MPRSAALLLLVACALLVVLVMASRDGAEDPLDPGEDESGAAGPALLAGRGAPEAQETTPGPAQPPAVKDAPTPLPVPEGRRRVRVRVVHGPDEHPIEGAALYAGEAPGGPRERSDARPLGYSDIDGAAHIEVPAREHLVSAVLPTPWMPQADGWITPQGTAVIVARPARVVRGVVHGLSDRQLASVHVVARWKGVARGDGDLQRLTYATCDRSGHFALYLPEHARDGHVYAVLRGTSSDEGARYAVAPLPRKDTDEAILDFRTARPISGTVVAADDTPVADARVDLAPIEWRSVLSLSVTLAAPSNAFVFPPVPPGRYRLRVFPLDTAHGFSTPVEVEAGARDVRVVVPDAGSVRGRVEGIGGLQEVSAQWWRSDHADQPLVLQQTVRVDADGRFYFGSVSDGHTELRIVAGGRVITVARNVRVPSEDLWIRTVKEKK